MIDKIHTKNGSSVEIRSRLSFELDLIRKAGLEQYIFGLAKLLSVAKKNKKPCFSLDLIPDDDSETFAMLSKGETNDLPLLNDNWMRKCLRILKPRNIDDLDALMSLYHNGPTDLIPMYMDAKRGMLSQNYQSIGDNDPLKRTYGVIVYKEQIVDILTKTSACSEADALSFCQALTQGKIKPVDQYEDKLEICIAKFYGSTHYAERIIDMIRAFSSEYHKRKIGFWHTTLTYRLAFIRCHYPDLFRNMLDTKPNKRL